MQTFKLKQYVVDHYTLDADSLEAAYEAVWSGDLDPHSEYGDLVVDTEE